MKYKLRREPLAQWKEREGRTFAWLAKKVGLSPDTLVGQMAGTTGVSLSTALALEEELGVPVRKLVEAVSE